jgi:hypothetical protein
MLLVTDQTYAEMRIVERTTIGRWSVGCTDVSWSRTPTKAVGRCDAMLCETMTRLALWVFQVSYGRSGMCMLRDDAHTPDNGVGRRRRRG